MPKLITDNQGVFGQLDTTEIEQKVIKYVSYIGPKINPETNVYIAHVFTKAMLEELWTDKDNYDGIRVYIVKEDDINPPPSAGQVKIGMLAVPVVALDNEFHNQLGTDDKVIYLSCPSKYCKSTTPGFPVLGRALSVDIKLEE